MYLYISFLEMYARDMVELLFLYPHGSLLE